MFRRFFKKVFNSENLITVHKYDGIHIFWKPLNMFDYVNFNVLLRRVCCISFLSTISISGRFFSFSILIYTTIALDTQLFPTAISIFFFFKGKYIFSAFLFSVLVFCFRMVRTRRRVCSRGRIHSDHKPQ